ncbi:MAG: ExbD/TolR family protein [Bacillota bacterium]
MHKPIPVKPLPSPKVEIINLIDVLISLIAFFLFTTVFIQYRYGFTIKLPEAEAGAFNNATEAIVVDIDKKGELAVNGKVVARHKLEQVFKGRGKNLPVFVRADKSCPFQWVVEILGKAKRAGLKKINLEALEKIADNRHMNNPVDK